MILKLKKIFSEAWEPKTLFQLLKKIIWDEVRIGHAPV
jgi:hypothetical protein